jgi:hypothetical protein
MLPVTIAPPQSGAGLTVFRLVAMEPGDPGYDLLPEGRAPERVPGLDPSHGAAITRADRLPHASGSTLAFSRNRFRGS